MLKPKKKITKKEIKQDQLITAYGKVTSFYEMYKKYISYGVTALVIIIVAIVIFVNNKRANNEKAATELGKIFAIYDAGTNDPKQYKMAIDGQPERGVMGLKKIVDSYGGTESGEVASLYLANAYYYLGNFDEALKYYEDFSSSNDMLSATALAGIANCLEIKKEYLKAAAKFEKAAEISPNPISTPGYLSSAGRCYGMGGEKEKAVSLFKRIKKEFPKSSLAREVDRYISQFSV